MINTEMYNKIRNVICDCSSMFLSRVVEVGFLLPQRTLLSVAGFRCGATDFVTELFLGCDCLLVDCRYHCLWHCFLYKNLAMKHLISVKSCTLSVFTVIILRVF